MFLRLEKWRGDETRDGTTWLLDTIVRHGLSKEIGRLIYTKAGAFFFGFGLGYVLSL